VRFVRIPEDPKEENEIELWVPALPPRVVRRQWQGLRGVRVIQAPRAGVDTLLGIFPSELTLCDAGGVYDIPTAEWTVTAILARQKKTFHFSSTGREKGTGL
jgi:phosphoglycerate dehydrogenase-like enzyme